MPTTLLKPRQASPLDGSQIQAFHEVGWITRKALFTSAEVARMRASFEDLENFAVRLPGSGLYHDAQFVLTERNSRQVIKRVVWAGGYQRYLLEVGKDPRLTVPCAQLLNSTAMDHLLNQAHFKRPGDGVMFDWHQDIQHRDKGNGTWTDVNGRGSFVQTLIVLDEMTPDNGPLKFMPGSPGWGRIQFDAPCDHSNCAPTQSLYDCCEAGAVTIQAAPGDVLFFGPYAAHASFPNTSDYYRRVLINGYAHPGANRFAYPGSGTGQRLLAPTGAGVTG
ncbi:MAG: phytanoyl-CoA dioxygenase family protein [Gammaproteobacteria bacterium]